MQLRHSSPFLIPFLAATAFAQQRATPTRSATEVVGPAFQFGDFDADGLADVFVLSPAQGDRLLRNQGDGTFADVSARVGLADVRGSRLAVWADYDGDGALDLYVGSSDGQSRLFHNEAKRFVDVTPICGVAHASGDDLFARFLDYDGDRRLDLHVTTRGGDQLFHNLGAGAFEPVDFGRSGAVIETVVPPAAAAASSPRARAASNAATSNAMGELDPSSNASSPSSLAVCADQVLNASGVCTSTMGLSFFGAAVDSGEITDGTIGTNDLADASITQAKLNNGAVNSVKILNNSIRGIDVMDGEITTFDIQDATIVTDDIADGTILGSDIASGTITGNQVMNNTIDSLDINDGSLTGVDIWDGTVGTNDLADGAVTSAKLAPLSVGSNQIQNGSIQMVDLGQNGASSGQVIKWNGSAWAPAADNGGSGSSQWTSNGAAISYTGGNVGVGTTSPCAPLAVVGTVGVDTFDQNTGSIANALQLGGCGSGEAIGSRRDGQPGSYGVDLYTNSLNRVHVDLNGSVGINTTAPDAKLDIVGTDAAGRAFDADGLITAGRYTAGPFIGINGAASSSLGGADVMNVRSASTSGRGGVNVQTDGANPYYGYQMKSGFIYTERASTYFDAPSGDWRLKMGANDRLRINGTSGESQFFGDVWAVDADGIFDTTYSDSVVVDGGNLNAGNLAQSVTFGDNSGEGIASRRQAGVNQYGLDFYTLFASRMSITNGGNVGIGTQSPGQKLDVAGNVRASGQLISGVGSGTAPLAVSSSTKVTSLNADLLDGVDSAAFSQLGPSIETAEITNGTIVFADLAANGASTGQVIQWNGSAWVAATVPGAPAGACLFNGHVYSHNATCALGQINPTGCVSGTMSWPSVSVLTCVNGTWSAPQASCSAGSTATCQ